MDVFTYQAALLAAAKLPFAPLATNAINPLTGMYHLSGFGAQIGTSLANAQATSDALDAILTTIGPTGSGRVWVEPSSSGYYLSRSHPLIRSGIQIEGFGGFPSGLPSSKFTAHSSGDFTNGAIADSVMFKPDTARNSGNPPNVWHHNWHIRGISFFGNSKVDTGILTYRNGESSGLSNIYVTGCLSDGIICEGGQATLCWNSVNSSFNGGHGVHFKKWYQGSGVITSFSGDGNSGKLIQITEGSVNADPASLTVVNFKSESNSSTSQHDAVIGLDSCHAQFSLIASGSALTVGGTDVVRIDTPASGGPSVTLTAEGTNLFNFGYTNIIRDTSTGQTIVASAAAPFTPLVLWNRKLLTGGSAVVQTVPAPAQWRVTFPVLAQPNVLTQGTWAQAINSGAIGNGYGFNNSQALNDEFRWYSPISAGAWKIEGLTARSSTGGIGTFDVSFDGGTTWSGAVNGKSLGTFDFYNASPTFNNNLTGSGVGWTAGPGATFTVPYDCVIILRLRMLAKNVSSSAYLAALQYVWFTRTS